MLNLLTGIRVVADDMVVVDKVLVELEAVVATTGIVGRNEHGLIQIRVALTTGVWTCLAGIPESGSTAPPVTNHRRK